MIIEIRADKSNLHAFDSVTTFASKIVNTVFCICLLLCLVMGKKLYLYYFIPGITSKNISKYDKLPLEGHFTNAAMIADVCKGSLTGCDLSTGLKQL